MISELFKKSIHRRIEGVIKADILDDSSILEEVNEYVVTDELHKKLDGFFDAYASTIGHPTQGVGVWISGFFGSGKSHLLKMLSYILSSRSVQGQIMGNLFVEKIDKDDFELIGNIKKSLTIPADTILFNIDTKADTGAASRSKSAILHVFLKVFNEHRGYYPKQPSIANFEKNLDKKGIYEGFKQAFKEISGSDWVIERDALSLEVDNAAKALSRVQNISQESALEQLSRLDEQFSMSIEDFANEVKEYIDTKDPNYRLIFLVDEIGQFIGDNSHVMLNFQSIVESLATKCQGQAWVVVTSQSAIRDLISSYDGHEDTFSKIMGRFDVTINLTSQNANEVIQRRLLEKKEESISSLSTLYLSHENTLRSIIHFSDRGLQYKNYSNNEEFVLTYPFVPYQLDLFQRAITGLSQNEMFQGKHTAIGERSMLNVFQKVAKELANEEVGTLASYDRFFDGISNIIRPELQTQISLASNSVDSFTLKVLKTLFMVKYVDGFTANIQNITTLLVDSLHVNVAKLTEQVKNSLNSLLSQVYIQKVGDVYAYLTNVEKDIENEIKRIEIHDTDITKELSEWIYDDIIKISKIRFSGNKHDYAFVRKLDGVRVKHGDGELMLDVITPFNTEGYTLERLQHKSVAENDVIVHLGENYEFTQDMRIYMQTKKFIPQRQSGNLTDQERYILQTKGTDNQKRKKELLDYLKKAFEEAKFLHNGKTLETNSSDIRRLIEGVFNEIIPSVYASISMLSPDYTEAHIASIVDNTGELFDEDANALEPAAREIHSFVQRSKNSNQIHTVQDIINKYASRPYGWYQAGITCMLAKLYARGFVAFTLNGSTLGSAEAKAMLTNSRQFNAIIKPIKVEPEKIAKAKSLLLELFPDTAFSALSATLLIETAFTCIQNRHQKLENYARLDYPFNQKLIELAQPYKTLLDAPRDSLIDLLLESEDKLLDDYEDDVLKLIEFMEHGQRQVYDTCRNFLRDQQPNLRHFDGVLVEELQSLLANPTIYKNGQVPQANALKTKIQESFHPHLESKRKEACAHIDSIISQLQKDEHFNKVPEPERHKVIRPLQSLQEQISHTSVIDSIVAMSQEPSLLTKGLERMEELIPQPTSFPDNEPPSKILNRVTLTSLAPKGSRLKSSEDVETYIAKLKAKLLDSIESNHEIIT